MTFAPGGDDATLDTAAIQKAIDTAAAAGGIITLKPGTYPNEIPSGESK
jgi:polygalacturonase